MATIAEFTIPANDFALGRVFERLPEAAIELERVVPTDDHILPYFWVRDGDADDVREILADEPSFLSVTLMDDLDDEGLFRAEWNPDVEGVLTAILESGLTLLSAFGVQGNWTFEFRAADTDQISTFQQYCTDHGINVTLTRLKSLAEMQVGDEYNLTTNQHEALLLAFEEGYYDDPRETDLETLASRVGISRPAFANRLRRGIRNVLGSTIAQHDSSDDAAE
ncbi:helix-turn-helix domain-containing protein [Halorussus limi]|uniref:Helix-turn-helix domain-containing protein n=1 Tax=Halorussus limi TaxID=2938695 RepID=A0A8U0HQQ5_9EURY|nr:bacterio-opsin activator domain-containing protein [Halorussus limi]UPV73375.1 helix-turn-helix domain-containing protein [Halorussus limi]